MTITHSLLGLVIAVGPHLESLVCQVILRRLQCKAWKHGFKPEPAKRNGDVH